MKKRLLASVLSLVMVLSLLPATARAEDDTEDPDEGAAVAETDAGPQWNFAPQHENDHAYSYY